MGHKKPNMEKTSALIHLEQGMPGKCVVEELGVNRQSIYRPKMEAAKLPLSTTPPWKPGSGGKRNSPTTDCILKCEVKKNPSITTAELKNNHSELLKTSPSATSSQHHLQKDLKLARCRAARKPVHGKDDEEKDYTCKEI